VQALKHTGRIAYSYGGETSQQRASRSSNRKKKNEKDRVGFMALVACQAGMASRQGAPRPQKENRKGRPDCFHSSGIAYVKKVTDLRSF